MMVRKVTTGEFFICQIDHPVTPKSVTPLLSRRGVGTPSKYWIKAPVPPLERGGGQRPEGSFLKRRMEWSGIIKQTITHNKYKVEMQQII